MQLLTFGPLFLTSSQISLQVFVLENIRRKVDTLAFKLLHQKINNLINQLLSSLCFMAFELLLFIIVRSEWFNELTFILCKQT